MGELEQLNHEELLDIVRRLGQALNFVDHVLTEDKAAHQIWAVSGVVGGPLPNLTPLSTMTELCELVADLRTRQLANPEEHRWMHIFIGSRVQIQKGPQWRLWDGKQSIPVTGELPPNAIDDTGSLFENIDLDRILANNAEAVAAVTTLPEIRLRPQVVGSTVDEDDDDVADPNEDPEIV